MKPYLPLIALAAALATLGALLAFQSQEEQPTENIQKEKPLRVGVASLTHSHVHWILGRPDRGDIELVGISEANEDLARRFTQRHNLDYELVYPSLTEMLDAVQPEAVTAFGSIYEHLEVVRQCAPRGIHVMVEKPLAVSMEHAREMDSLARAHNIQLLTNYETTWYATHHEAYQMIKEEDRIGALRKIVVHDGHPGPKAIGVNSEFMDWLGDPALNGGGAVVDFGCYGANLITWLMEGRRPTSVLAVTQHFQPEAYPKVDDEATIIVTYPETQGIVQASWNWPFSRKDMHIYGQTGYIYCDNRSQMRTRLSEKEPEETVKFPERPAPYDDPFAYLAGVVRGKIKPAPYALSSLENNLIVVEILDAARESAGTGKAIVLGTED
jgi:predicted dehydrogenase